MKIPYLWHGEVAFVEGLASLEGGLNGGGPLYSIIYDNHESIYSVLVSLVHFIVDDKVMCLNVEQHQR